MLEWACQRIATILSSLPLLSHHWFYPPQVICHSSIRVRMQAVFLVSDLLLRCATSLSASEKLLLVRYLGFPFNRLLPLYSLWLSYLLVQHFPPAAIRLHTFFMKFAFLPLPLPSSSCRSRCSSLQQMTGRPFLTQL